MRSSRPLIGAGVLLALPLGYLTTAPALAEEKPWGVMIVNAMLLSTEQARTVTGYSSTLLDELEQDICDAAARQTTCSRGWIADLPVAAPETVTVTVFANATAASAHFKQVASELRADGFDVSRYTTSALDVSDVSPDGASPFLGLGVRVSGRTVVEATCTAPAGAAVPAQVRGCALSLADAQMTRAEVTYRAWVKWRPEADVVSRDCSVSKNAGYIGITTGYGGGAPGGVANLPGGKLPQVTGSVAAPGQGVDPATGYGYMGNLSVKFCVQRTAGGKVRGTVQVLAPNKASDPANMSRFTGRTVVYLESCTPERLPSGRVVDPRPVVAMGERTVDSDGEGGPGYLTATDVDGQYAFPALATKTVPRGPGKYRVRAEFIAASVVGTSRDQPFSADGFAGREILVGKCQ